MKIISEEFKEYCVKSLFVLGMVTLVSAFIIGYFAAMSVRMKHFTVDRTFYFLSVRADPGTVSVAAKSEYSEGGAGYTFTSGKNNYVALAGYNDEREATIVRDNLKAKGKECEIVPLKVDSFYFTDKKEVAVYEETRGFVNTLLSCVDLAYETANRLEEGRFTQKEAGRVLGEIGGVLEGAEATNVPAAAKLAREGSEKCDEITEDIIYAKEVRYLQLMLSEGIYDLQKLFVL